MNPPKISKYSKLKMLKIFFPSTNWKITFPTAQFRFFFSSKRGREITDGCGARRRGGALCVTPDTAHITLLKIWRTQSHGNKLWYTVLILSFYSSTWIWIRIFTLQQLNQVKTEIRIYRFTDNSVFEKKAMQIFISKKV